eukprot:5760255-Alexandrium_andersonii.AAC.1
MNYILQVSTACSGVWADLRSTSLVHIRVTFNARPVASGAHSVRLFVVSGVCCVRCSMCPACSRP